MALTEADIKARLLNSFENNNVSDDLTNLMADFSARFLYLEQIIDTNILMEGSYTRSKKLNSRITHAADNFYSVWRGKNRTIRIANIRTSEAIIAKKYDVISSYGQYKLVHMNDCNKQAGETTAVFDCYLTLGREELELQGSGKLYLDIPGKDISEDIIVMDKLTGEEYTLTRNVHDLDIVDPSEEALEESYREYDMATVTGPDYTVRLWSDKIFEESNTYIVKYLKCPNRDVEDLNLAGIINIPQMIKQDTTTIKELTSTNYPTTDLDEIYQYTASFVKTKDIIRTLDNLDSEIKKYFGFKGFNTVVTPTTITVYYVVSYGTPEDKQGDFVDATKLANFTRELKAHYVTQNVTFERAAAVNPFDESGESGDEKFNFRMTVYITKEINYDTVKSIVESYQSKVGQPVNFYQLIADLKGEPSISSGIKSIVIPNEYMNVISLGENERIYFDSLTIDYEFVNN